MKSLDWIKSKAKKLTYKYYVPILKKNMKIGVSYNLFDGEELLPYSIKAIRNKVHHINIVYQNISNFGNPASPDLETKLQKMKEEGLIDEIYLYEPDLKKEPQYNEKIKRDIGLKIAKKNRCNYFLGMDVDEFYDEIQFENAIKYIALHRIMASAVNIIEYLKSPGNQILGLHTFSSKNNELCNYYVPFLIKINKFGKQRHGKGYFPCLTDPTRKLFNKGRFKLFSANEIVMHHMSTVRKDLSKKYENSSTLCASKANENCIKAIQEHVSKFDINNCQKIDENHFLYGLQVIKRVENKFKIKID